MKRLVGKVIMLGVVLGVLLLTLGLSGFALANPGDGLDVDITVVGDDADVDVSVYGDNANISVNGDGLATMEALQNATSRGGGQGDLITWLAARRADKWIREIGQFLPDATAILIMKSEDHNTQLAVVATQLEEYGLSISVNSDSIVSLQEITDALDARTTSIEERIEVLQQFQLDMERKWWITIVVATGVLAVASVLALNFGMRRS